MVSGILFGLNWGCAGRHIGESVENIRVVCAGLEISDALRVISDALRAIPDALSRFSDALKVVCDGLGLARDTLEVQATIIYSRVI
jgi:hypothetical protein